MLEKRAEVRSISKLERSTIPVYEVEYDYWEEDGSKFEMCPMVLRVWVADELGAYVEFKKHCEERNINVIWL